MLKKIDILLIAFIFIFISAIALIIYTKQREQEYRIQNSQIQKTAIKGAAYAINLQLKTKQRHVQLFAYEHSNLLSHLKQYPQDLKTDDEVKARLSQRFPDFFAYTITDQHAKPKLFDIESLVGDVCRKDIVSFVKRIEHSKNKSSVTSKASVHPQAFHYHYDVMTALTTNSGKTDVFFISFHLDEIVKILKSHQTDGNQLLLLKQSDTSLIEANSNGARDNLSRETRLSEEEKNRIEIYENIPDTDWRVANLPNLSYKEAYKIDLWKNAGLILFIEILSVLVLLYLFSRMRKKQY